MTRYEALADAIGGTPLIRLNRLTAGLRPAVYVKLESANPAGSVKDRAALWMLRAAEADGSLQPGGIVVETTSGNTGIGLAAFAAHLGYRSVIFTSSAVSAEKRALLTAYGAEVRLVDSFVPRDHPDSLRSHAQRFVAETPGAWLADQYDNPANPDAHLASTGPELWDDTEGRITHLVATVGTGGTISGTGRYLKQVSEGRVTVVGADPFTSSYSGGDGSQKYIEGAGHVVHPDADQDAWPSSLDTGVIDRYVAVDDRTAIEAIRRLAEEEGILAGGSSGIALAAALDVAAELDEDDVVAVILPDSGRAYLSTYFNDDWLVANGFSEPATALTTVREVLPEGTPLYLVNKDVSLNEATAALDAAGADPDDPVVVVYARERELAPHPSEVVGWTTPAVLDALAREAERTDLLAEARPTVGDVAYPVHARVGIGLTPFAALEAARAADPVWSAALVLQDGRVAALVARADLERAVEEDGHPMQAVIDGFVEMLL
ncbi:PLP-dependent cysteine synthase family protein [Rathayibacter sp. CAU 1779]